MDKKQKQKAPMSGPRRSSSSVTSTPISIKSSTSGTPAQQSPASSTTPSSWLSRSMQSSFKHEVFDFGSPHAPSIPIIVSTHGQGFQWNREVFLKDEYYYYNTQNARPQVDERIVAHEIHLDEEDLMFQ